MQYTGSLHNHSEYSNLRLRDAISRTKAMMEYAGELGYKVLGITEHESISNAIKVEKEYKKIKEKYPDLKVIRGNEIYLCRDGLSFETFIKGEDKYFHFILLAKDAEGHKQIREISTRAWLRSYTTGKMRRVPTYYQDIIDIIAPNPGHVVASTACLGGYLGTMLLKYHEAGDSLHIMHQITNWLSQMKRLFGVGNFYLEMQPSKNDEQIYVNKEILKLSDSLNIPYIITTDTHYLKKEDAPIHKAFLNAQEGDREVDSFYETTYMMGTEELENFFPYMTREQLDTAYQNILSIGNNCEDYTLFKPLKIPSLTWRIPKAPISSLELHTWFKRMPWLKKFYYSSFDGDKRLAELIIEKVKGDERLQYVESYNEINDNLRITWESSEVNKAHWSAYFLNLQKILEVCWNAGTLVGPGRGSGVGFYLLYILDICQINPMWETTKTYSWRLAMVQRPPLLGDKLKINLVNA